LLDDGLELWEVRVAGDFVSAKSGRKYNEGDEAGELERRALIGFCSATGIGNIIWRTRDSLE